MPLIYKPLSPRRAEIRVLILLPSQPQHPVRCIMRTISLDIDRDVKYDALSYTWGDPASRAPIFVDDQQILVTVNLEAALRRLRHAQDPRTVWADAICINQDDIAEKTHQVPQMGRVYSTAQRVVVWLGNSTPEVEVALTWLRWHEAIKTQERENRGYYQEFKSTSATEVPAEADKAVQGLLDIFNRPYWSRMWTFQEFRLAQGEDPLVLCGDLVIPIRSADALLYELPPSHTAPMCRETEWDESPEWAEGADQLRYAMGTRTDAYQRAKSVAGKLWVKEGDSDDGMDEALRATFAGLLWESRGRKCTVQHDRLYALHGLSPDMQAACPPDYGKEIRQVVFETVKHLIHATTCESGRHGKKILSTLMTDYCLYEDRLTNPHYPSWLPDLTRSTSDSDLEAGFLGQFAPRSSQHRFRSGARLERVDPTNNLLLARGQPLGVCTAILLRLESDIPALAQQVYELLRDPDAFLSGVNIRGWKTLGRDCRPPSLRERLEEALFCYSPSHFSSLGGRVEVDRFVKQWEGGGHGVQTERGGRGASTTPCDIISRLPPFIPNLRAKTIVLLSSRAFAIGPRDVEVGDILTVVKGLSYPCVLRPLDPIVDIEEEETSGEDSDGEGEENEGKNAEEKDFGGEASEGEDSEEEDSEEENSEEEDSEEEDSEEGDSEEEDEGGDEGGDDDGKLEGVGCRLVGFAYVDEIMRTDFRWGSAKEGSPGYGKMVSYVIR